MKPATRIVRSPTGFTLTELSIVLVILALIAGGVMLGKELITLGQARKLMTQMEQFQLAVNTFKLKYNCLPGDCAIAENLNLGPNGNGNGLNGNPYGQSTVDCLQGTLNSASRCATNVPGMPVWYSAHSFGEHQRFWAHLSAAGLIKERIISNTEYAGVDQAMDRAYPRDALGRQHLHATMWNGKLYIRTGLAPVDPTWGTTQYGQGAMDSSIMQVIHFKFYS